MRPADALNAGSARDVMYPTTEQPGAAGRLPRTVRILPGRFRSWAGLAGGLALAVIFLWLAIGSPGRAAAIFNWLALACLVLTATGPGLRLLLQLPLIEASELGIAIWLNGPYRRPFFAPWKRVRAIVLTKARSAQAADGSGARDALGIELDQDDAFRLPPMPPQAEVPVGGAQRADLVWSSRSISGDPRRWVDLLARMKAAHTDAPA